MSFFSILLIGVLSVIAIGAVIRGIIVITSIAMLKKMMLEKIKNENNGDKNVK